MDDMDHVGNIRGIGLMAAVELVEDKATKQSFPSHREIRRAGGPRAHETRSLYPHAWRYHLFVPAVCDHN